MIKRFDIEEMDMENAGVISSKIKKELIQLNISKEIVRRVAIASYESEINVIIHSLGGYCEYILTEDDLTISYIDKGPGIEDIDLAMTPGYSTASREENELGFGAGMGFSNMKKNADKLTVTSSKDGTNVTLYFKLR